MTTYDAFHPSLSRSQSSIKRVFDVFFSAFGLLFTWWLILLAWLAACFDTKSNGFFIQKRVGRYGKVFRVVKVKTMIQSAGFDTTVTFRGDPRITPLGAFFRRTKIDELPQLWNVLLGDMSFVGPRPALFNQNNLIALRKEKGIDKLLPGITGWAQVNGRDSLFVTEKVDLDEVYMQRQSFWFDMKILWMTFLKVVKRDGVSH